MTYEEKLREAAEEYFHYNPEEREKTTFEDASRIVMTILKTLKDIILFLRPAFVLKQNF